MRILVVDDEHFVIEMLRLALAGRGHTVAGVTWIEDIAQTCASFQPQGAILDFRMPHGGGLQALERIRRWGRIPVVFYTKYADSDLECAQLAAVGVGQQQVVLKLDAFEDAPLLLRGLGEE